MGEGSREWGRSVRGGAWLLRPHGGERERGLEKPCPRGFPGGPRLCRCVAPAHPVRLPASLIHKLHPAATAVPSSEGPQTKLRSTHAWFMVAGAAPGEGSGQMQTGSDKGLRTSSGLGIEGE